MKKWIKRILVVVLLAVFLFSGGTILVVLRQYEESRETYDNAAAAYTRPNPAGNGAAGAAAGGAAPAETGGAGEAGSSAAADPADGAAVLSAERVRECAPITVDFAGLQAANPDVVGWIWCEGTAINYPLLQGPDNDYYLHRSYDRSSNAAGSIFVEELNRPGLADANTIIYGHNMRNGSMFAALQNWADQSFYEAHPVLWLLTPERDYRVEIMAGYTTSGGSDAYSIYTEPGPELDAYLETALARSDFRAAAEPEPGARWVLLSTCTYVFETSRYVLHGMLCPVDSAGGAPKAEP